MVKLVFSLKQWFYANIKISVITNISAVWFYGYIGYLIQNINWLKIDHNF